MEKQIKNYFKERPDLLKLGEFIVERTYDTIVNNYAEVYNGGKYNPNFGEIVNQFLEKLDTDREVALEGLTKIIVINTTLSLLNNLFMRDADYRLILEKLDDRDILQMIDISEISDGFTGDMLGEGGWLDLYSKYGDCKEYMGK